MDTLYLNVWSIIKSAWHMKNHRNIWVYVSNIKINYNSGKAKLLRPRAGSLKLLIKNK